MKKCPYCAEEIQDEAIKCRFCGSDLSEGASGATGPEAGAPAEAAVHYSHTGHRYLLGTEGDHYGIWDRNSQGAPVERFPRTTDGWGQAWTRYASLEPHNAPVVPLHPGSLATGQPRTNGMAVAALVLGILWIWAIGSILALIFGFISKNEIEKSAGQQGGRGMAIAGIVLGFIGIGLTIYLMISFSSALRDGLNVQ